LERLQKRIEKVLASNEPLSAVTIKPARHSVLMERVLVRVRTLPLASFTHTAIEVSAADRPGLLAALAYTITKAGFSIHGAAISSFGERVVDVFFVQEHGNPLQEEAIQQLCIALEKVAMLPKDDRIKDE